MLLLSSYTCYFFYFESLLSSRCFCFLSFLNGVVSLRRRRGRSHAPVGCHSVVAQAGRGTGMGRGGWGGVGGTGDVVQSSSWGSECLGAVILFTVGLVPQDAVHLVRDWGGQLWKDLPGKQTNKQIRSDKITWKDLFLYGGDHTEYKKQQR